MPVTNETQTDALCLKKKLWKNFEAVASLSLKWDQRLNLLLEYIPLQNDLAYYWLTRVAKLSEPVQKCSPIATMLFLNRGYKAHWMVFSHRALWPRVLFSAFQGIFLLMMLRFNYGTTKNSGQRFDNLNRTHLVLAGRKLVLQNKLLLKQLAKRGDSLHMESKSELVCSRNISKRS